MPKIYYTTPQTQPFGSRFAAKTKHSLQANGSNYGESIFSANTAEDAEAGLIGILSDNGTIDPECVGDNFETEE